MKLRILLDNKKMMQKSNNKLFNFNNIYINNILK